MTVEQTALRAAQEALREAKQLELADSGNRAENYWRAAERLYAEAGVDSEWFETPEPDPSV